MDIWSVVAGVVLVAVLVWPVVARYLSPKTSMDVFAVGAGCFALIIGALERSGIVFADPYPSVYIALGALLVVLGMSGKAMRLAVWLVAFSGLVVAAVTLQRFRGDDYQGTGSLILFLVFGLYLVSAIARKWRDLLFGPTLIVGGAVDYARGHGDPRVLIASGVICTLLSIGQRTARWEALIGIFADPLKIAALSVGGIGLVSGHHDVVWSGAMIYWSLEGSSVKTTSPNGQAANVAR